MIVKVQVQVLLATIEPIRGCQSYSYHDSENTVEVITGTAVASPALCYM